jgi:MYXO-CTERM domain-containing protein
MTQSTQPKQHRKFIAVILATALAITGVSSTPVQAGDNTGKIVAGLAVLGVLGAALHRHNTRDRRRSQEVVTRPHRPTPGPQPRPLPPRLGRYDLPAQCVKYFPNFRDGRSLVARGCLKRNYGSVHALPQSCKVTFWNGNKNRTAYKPRCLKNHGYRLVNR